MDLARYTALFLADGRDHLKRASAQLLEWERTPEAAAPVTELFRAFHSLKSSAAAIGLDEVASFSHRAEHLLEVVRRRELAPSKAVIGLLFRAVDVLDRGLEPATQGERLTDLAPLGEALERLTSTAGPAGVAVELRNGDPSAEEPGPGRGDGAAPGRASIRTVRVDPGRLDEVLNQAGELVVARNRLMALAAERNDPDLDRVAGQIDTVVRGLHAGVLRARLAPITELFGRFPRLVRDLGVSLGKAARLELRGEGIELDRTVLEELVDPLIHLLRNAVDHGIEPPGERSAKAKPAEGRLLLAAERRRDWVVIRLSDDGRGVDREAVVRRAREMGIDCPAAERLDDAELLSLIARPGFTVKREVTAVSGRGVGMDAVVSRVRALGGRLDLHSTTGRGTELSVTVPLTTAIQRILLVRAGSQRYGIPFRLVREAARGEEPAVSGRFTVRGRTLPMVDLAAAAADPLAAGSTATRPVLVLEWNAEGGAVLVDGLLGQHDVLVERIAAPRGLPLWVSGATILADGSPAFVLDPTALFEAEATIP